MSVSLMYNLESCKITFNTKARGSLPEKCIGKDLSSMENSNFLVHFEVFHSSSP